MDASNEKEFSVVEAITLLVQTLQYILSKWWVIAIAGLLCGSGGVLYAWLKKPLYIAEMNFVAEGEPKNGLGVYSGIAAQFGLDLGQGGGGAFEGENLIELLKSKTLIKKTLL